MLLFISSCGSIPKNQNKTPELDTSLYNKYIRTGIDTNIYPLFQFASSQKQPIHDFGFDKLFDNDPKTFWSSDLGLNAGEWVAFRFDGLKITSLKVDISKDFINAKINSFQLFVNDSLFGVFTSGVPIPISVPIFSLKIKANDADGMNEVILPINKDSIGDSFLTTEKISTRYNSKSFGIAEIEFFGKNNKKLPMKALPSKKVIVQQAYFKIVDERINIADGNPTTPTSWFKADNEGKLILIFDDYTAFTKLRIYSEPNPLYNYPTMGEILFSISGKPDQEYKLKSGMNEFVMKEPFVAKTYTISMKKFLSGTNEGSFNEVQGFDGLQWYTLIGDSLYEKGNNLKDSLKNTPLHPILNTEVIYYCERANLKSDTFVVQNVKSIPTEWIKERTDDVQKLLIRSNFTFQASAQFNTLTLGKTPSYYNKVIEIEGIYRLEKKSVDEVVLITQYKLNTILKKDGKETSKKIEYKKGQFVIKAQTVWMDGLITMKTSY